jgi:hypothetical protein
MSEGVFKPLVKWSEPLNAWVFVHPEDFKRATLEPCGIVDGIAWPGGQFFALRAESLHDEKPEPLRFFSGPGCALMSNRPIDGLTQNRPSGVCGFFICESVTSSAARLLAEKFGAIYRDA